MAHSSLIIANWKMQLSPVQEKVLAKKMNDYITSHTSTYSLVVCPSFLSLQYIGDLLKFQKKIKSFSLGAQNSSFEMKGAYTGEVSPVFLRASGCSYVIVGHSERRSGLMEDDVMIGKKIKAAYQAKLVPVVCIGESKEEKEAGRTMAKLEQQIKGALSGLEASSKKPLILAYEPLWAIGTHSPLPIEQCKELSTSIRNSVKKNYPALLSKLTVLYGGSITDKNANDYLADGLFDGILLGSASQSFKSFRSLLGSIKK